MIFGVAGYPKRFNESKYGKDRFKVFKWLNELGLDALELQMTYGPRTSPEKCKRYRDLSIKHEIRLSVHASYFIVLTSPDKSKIDRSCETLHKTLELSELLDAKDVVLHPGFYHNEDSETITERLISNLKYFFNEYRVFDDIRLFLETAGKVNQFGSINEILEVCDSIEQCHPCVDFGHVHARTLGLLSKNENIDAIFHELKEAGYTGKTKKPLHFHYTPIHYGGKGEIKHKSLTDRYPIEDQLSMSFADTNEGELYYPRFERIIENLFRYEIDCTMISETRNTQEEGAISMKRYYQKLL